MPHHHRRLIKLTFTENHHLAEKCQIRIFKNSKKEKSRCDFRRMCDRKNLIFFCIQIFPGTLPHTFLIDTSVKYYFVINFWLRHKICNPNVCATLLKSFLNCVPYSKTSALNTAVCHVFISPFHMIIANLNTNSSSHSAQLIRVVFSKKTFNSFSLAFLPYIWTLFWK